MYVWDEHGNARTAHELARELLCLPDCPVRLDGGEYPRHVEFLRDTPDTQEGLHPTPTHQP